MLHILQYMDFHSPSLILYSWTVSFQIPTLLTLPTRIKWMLFPFFLSALRMCFSMVKVLLCIVHYASWIMHNHQFPSFPFLLFLHSVSRKFCIVWRVTSRKRENVSSSASLTPTPNPGIWQYFVMNETQASEKVFIWIQNPGSEPKFWRMTFRKFWDGYISDKWAKPSQTTDCVVCLSIPHLINFFVWELHQIKMKARMRTRTNRMYLYLWV